MKWTWPAFEKPMKFVGSIIALAGTIIMGYIGFAEFNQRQPNLLLRVDNVVWDTMFDQASLVDRLDFMQERHGPTIGYRIFTLKQKALGLTDRRSMWNLEDFLKEMQRTIDDFADGDQPQKKVAVQLDELKAEIDESRNIDRGLSVTVHVQNTSQTPNAILSIGTLRISYSGCDDGGDNRSIRLSRKQENGKLDGYEGRTYEFNADSAIHYLDASAGCPGAKYAFGLSDVGGKVWVAEWQPRGVHGSVLGSDTETLSELEVQLDDYLDKLARED